MMPTAAAPISAQAHPGSPSEPDSSPVLLAAAAAAAAAPRCPSLVDCVVVGAGAVAVSVWTVVVVLAGVVTVSVFGGVVTVFDGAVTVFVDCVAVPVGDDFAGDVCVLDCLSVSVAAFVDSVAVAAFPPSSSAFEVTAAAAFDPASLTV